MNGFRTMRDKEKASTEYGWPHETAFEIPTMTSQ